MTRRGPRDITKATLTIAEGMTGEPLSEEIADLVTDAIWDAFAAGRESVKAKKRAASGGAHEEGTATTPVKGRE